MLGGRSAGARFIVVCPGIEVNPVESDTASSNGNLRQVGADLRIERALVHPEIGRGIAHSDKTWCKHVITTD